MTMSGWGLGWKAAVLLHAILIALPARDGGLGVTVPELCGGGVEDS